MLMLIIRKDKRILLSKKGDKGILIKWMYVPVFGEERYAIQKIKTGMVVFN